METIIPDNFPPKFPDAFWENLASAQAIRIKDDAADGIMQNGNTYQYKSVQYKRYKNNNMRRLTLGAPTGMLNGRPTYFKNKRSKYYKDYISKKGVHGNRLKGYDGVQIVSDTTSWVDMTLTGHMFRRLLSNAKALGNDSGCKIFYGNEDAGKVIGNKEHGYDVLGMRKVNQDFTFNEILKQFDETVRPIWEKNIIITIGE